jgi:predicted negative regulator of RcsB-dependent stress response
VDELSEQEQWENLKRWVRVNGPQVLVMAAVMLLGVFGWRWWQGRGEAEAQAASAMYQSILGSLDEERLSEAEGLIETLRAEHPDSPYVSAADLVAARVYVESNQLDKAADQLKRVATSAPDELLRPVAQVRLARVQLALGNYDEALATLGDKPLGAQESARLEARGDILLAQDDLAGALASYEEARQVHPGGREDSRELLDLKIADLKGLMPAAAEQP